MNKDSNVQCWTLFTDGSSCATDKTAAIGFVLYKSLEEDPVQRFGNSIPYVTSHAAEYKAVIHGLKAAYQKGVRIVELRCDLQTMVNQLNGTCKVNAAHLKPLYEEAKKQIERFATVTIVCIDRKQNVVAHNLAANPASSAKPLTETSVAVSPLKSSSEAKPVTLPSPTLPQQFWKPVGNELCVWDLENLWAIVEKLPLETIAVTELHAFLDTPGWFGDEPLTLRRIAELSYQTNNADAKKPLLICDAELLDGRFRLAKALSIGQSQITLKRLKHLPDPDARYPLRYAP